MTAKHSYSILKQTLAPVILVIIFWIMMSLGTTHFIVSVENSNQRIFAENVVSTRAARNLQILVWKLAADFPTSVDALVEFKSEWPSLKASMEFERNELDRTAYLDEEFIELPNLNEKVTNLTGLIDLFLRQSRLGENGTETLEFALERKKAHELAKQIVASAQKLCDMNQAVVDQHRADRKLMNSRVITTRWTILALGPLIGVLLGWRFGNRLRRSIARIAVTLHDAGSSSNSDLGVVDIDASGDFENVEMQAEHVAERMRNVSRELHAARSEVLQSERLAAVGGLAAGVAHEIRNPLTSVKLLLQHAVRHGANPNLDESNVRLILEEIARMEKTIQGLLDFSRPPKLNRVNHDFRQTLRRAINLIVARSRQQQIEIEANISDTTLMVDGDTEKLHQLLVNLLINALDAMPDGGRLSIDATLRPASENSASQNGPPKNVGKTCSNVIEITIKDTGEGIANEVLSRLFEPFATTKEGGTGLGLAVSHRIVEEHGGAIRACNDPDVGACFTLTIPSSEVPVEVLSL